MGLSRRAMLGRSLIGAAFAPFTAKAGAQSLASRLGGCGLPGAGAGGDQSAGYGRPVVNKRGAEAFTSLWWDRNRVEAEEHVLQQGWTLPLDADVTGMRSLSPMAQQRIMRRRWIERDLAQRTMWDRVRRMFEKEG
jgi:hypothetical protein